MHFYILWPIMETILHMKNTSGDKVWYSMRQLVIIKPNQELLPASVIWRDISDWLAVTCKPDFLE